MKLDTKRVTQLIEDLFRIADELTAMTGRAFTPDGHLVGLRLQRAAAFEEIYNGPAKPVLEKLSIHPLQKNGQRTISLTDLRALNLQIGAADRLSRVGTQEFA